MQIDNWSNRRGDRMVLIEILLPKDFYARLFFQWFLLLFFHSRHIVFIQLMRWTTTKRKTRRKITPNFDNAFSSHECFALIWIFYAIPTLLCCVWVYRHIWAIRLDCLFICNQRMSFINQFIDRKKKHAHTPFDLLN